MSYKYMPVSLSISDRECLVVGGGSVALRKVETLMEYAAAITVVAPELHEKLEYYAGRGDITVEKRGYRSPEAGAYGLVISASDDRSLNEKVYEDAHGAGTLVNVVDDPKHCDFVFPAVLRRDCLTTAISTDGKAPFMSGHLRLVLENVFPAHWEKLMKLAAKYRTMVIKRWHDNPEKKNMCYAEFLEADWKRMFKEMKPEELEAELERMLEIPA